MKKIICVVFLTLVAAVSCTKRNADEITFAVGGAPDEVKVWKEITRKFRNNTGIRVKLIRQPSDSDLRRQGLVVPLKAKQADPDIFTMDVAWIGQFAASGWLEEIKAHQIDTRPVFEKVFESTDIYDSRIIAAPVNIDAGVLYYRKDLVKKPPETWEELELFSTLFMQKNPGKYGYVWQGAQYEGLVCNFLETAVSAGGGIKIEQGNVVLNTPENVRALEFMRSMIHDSGISPENTFTEMKEEETRNFFQRGDALFERNWPYAWALHGKEGSFVKGKTGMAPLPHFKGHKSAAALGGWHAGISAYSRKKDKALLFLNYIISYDVQKKFALKLGWNPGRKDVYDDADVLAALPHFSRLKNVFLNAVARPNVPYYTRVSAVLQKELNSVLAGKTGAENALKEAEKEIKEIMKRYEK